MAKRARGSALACHEAIRHSFDLRDAEGDGGPDSRLTPSFDGAISSRRNSSIGPIHGLVIGFPGNNLFEGRIAEELGRLSDNGQIRIIDAVFVMREDDDVSVLSVSDLDDDQRPPRVEKHLVRDLSRRGWLARGGWASPASPRTA